MFPSVCPTLGNMAKHWQETMFPKQLFLSLPRAILSCFIDSEHKMHQIRRGRDIKTVANVWNPVLFCFTCVSDFVYQLEAIIFIRVVNSYSFCSRPHRGRQNANR